MAQDDFLTRCVVDPVARKFYLYSEQGDEKVVECDTIDQFMGVLELCRAMLDEETLAYQYLQLCLLFGPQCHKLDQKQH